MSGEGAGACGDAGEGYVAFAAWGEGGGAVMARVKLVAVSWRLVAARCRGCGG